MKYLIFILFFAFSISLAICSTTCDQGGQCMVIDGKSEHLDKAISSIEKAIYLTKQILDEDTRSCVANRLISYKKELQMHYFSNQFEDLSEKGDLFFENIEEVIADCADSELRLQITSAIQEMLNELREVEKA